MGRRRAGKRAGIFSLIALMPWPLGVVLGVIAFLAVRYGMPWMFSHVDNPYFQLMGGQLNQGLCRWLAWGLLAICGSAALISFLRDTMASKTRRRGCDERKRRPKTDETGRPLDHSVTGKTQSKISVTPDEKPISAESSGPTPLTGENISNLSWLQFEHLIADSFRSKGFMAELTPDGADGGVDIVLRERDNVLLVQCKHWMSRFVGVDVVRALFGVMNAQGARKAILATSGQLSPDARRFCDDNAIYYIDADRLYSFVDPAAMPPQRDICNDRRTRCPLCGSAMQPRTAKQSGRRFWGCSRFPACRGQRFGTVLDE